jgi:hypothetical protein
LEYSIPKVGKTTENFPLEKDIPMENPILVIESLPGSMEKPPCEKEKRVETYIHWKEHHRKIPLIKRTSGKFHVWECPLVENSCPWKGLAVEFSVASGKLRCGGGFNTGRKPKTLSVPGRLWSMYIRAVEWNLTTGLLTVYCIHTRK